MFSNQLGIAVIGFIIFLVLEGCLHWHHCEECEMHTYNHLMIIGESIHNFIDGLVLAGTFMTSISLGLVTSLMIMGHELPQGVGVFGVLVSGGFKRERAMLYSFLAQSTCILGGILGLLFFKNITTLTYYLLPFAAGGFIYIAAADLIPRMHKTEGKEKIFLFIWLCAGLLSMAALKIVFRS